MTFLTALFTAFLTAGFAALLAAFLQEFRFPFVKPHRQAHRILHQLQCQAHIHPSAAKPRRNHLAEHILEIPPQGRIRRTPQQVEQRLHAVRKLRRACATLQRDQRQSPVAAPAMLGILLPKRLRVKHQIAQFRLQRRPRLQAAFRQFPQAAPNICGGSSRNEMLVRAAS